MFIPDIYNIFRVLKKKGYKIYDGDPYDVNLVGIRTSDNTPNEFNDWFVLFYKFRGDWIFNYYTCTTDPGLYWLNNPMNELGTAILKEGQYVDCFKIGNHKGYNAIVQAKPVTVIRDFNRDNNLDYESGVEDYGMFGINIHRASEYHESVQIDKWSAGCQVINDPAIFIHIMNIVHKSSAKWDSKLTYTLLHERDFKTTWWQKILPIG